MKKWNEKTTLQKVLDIISCIALCIWVIFEAVEKTNNAMWAGFVNCSAIFVVCICEAISFWNTKRAFSYVAIAGAVCLMAVMVLQIMLVA